MSMPLFPEPKRMEAREGALRLGGRTVLAVAPGEMTESRARLLQALWAQCLCAGGSLDLEQDRALAPHTARIGSCPPMALKAGDSYALQVTPEGASLVGRDAESLLHALLTLAQAVDPLCLEAGREAFEIACMEVRDRPSLGVRGIHLCVFPETTPLLLEKAIRMAGFLKMNLVVLEFWGVYPFRCLPELCWAGHAFELSALRDLLDLARALGMEVVPMFNHLGHATQSRGGCGRHAVLDQSPRHALLFEPDGWTWCLSNPETHRILRACREELMDCFGPGRYFHLGCDESYSYATCPRCAGRDKAGMLADFLNGLAEELGQSGRRGILWGDQFLEAAAWPKPYIATSGPEQRTHEALDRLDRRLILNDWQYALDGPELGTSRHFMDKGFDVWACPWEGPGNGAALAAAMDRMQGQGFLVTTWHRLPSMLPILPELCGCAWNGAGYRQRPWQRVSAMALLRKAMPVAGSFERAGFMPFEVDAAAFHTIG